MHKLGKAIRLKGARFAGPCARPSRRMLSKHTRPYDAAALPPGKRVRANVGELFANNTLPASRVQDLINDIADAGIAEMAPLRRKADTNAARNLRRAYLKGCQWPQLYWAEIRVQVPRTNTEEKARVAFLLPHEFLEVLSRLGDKEKVYQSGGLDNVGASHLHRSQNQASAQFVPLGI